MATKVVTSRASGDGAVAGEALAKGLQEGLAGATPVLVLAFASTKQSLAELAGKLSAAFPGATLLTSSTAGEFVEGGDAKGEAVGWALASDAVKVTAATSTGLAADPSKAVEAALPADIEDPDFPHQTAIVLVDPLTGTGEEAALLASALLGPSVRLAGGAAGDDLKFEETQVGLGDQIGPDRIVIARLASKAPLGIGVRHGHKPVSGPLTVTKAEGAVVHEIDGRPAFQVWKDAVREAAKEDGIDVDAAGPDEIGGHLLSYEVGLIVGPTEYKIRAPLSVGDNDSLNFACGLPEGSVVRVMRGPSADQVESARAAAVRARQGLGDHKVAGALVFDCICRNLVLGERFAEAVKQMHEALDGAPLAGFETYGEIAMELGQTSGFHNTTTVVLAFPEV